MNGAFRVSGRGVGGGGGEERVVRQVKRSVAHRTSRDASGGEEEKRDLISRRNANKYRSSSPYAPCFHVPEGFE